MRKLLTATMFVVALYAADAAACYTDTATPQTGFQRTFRNDVNKDLADYGLIFEDAKRRDCSGGSFSPINGAYKALLDKVTSTLNSGTHTDPFGRVVGPYQGWLEGSQVTLIMSAALQIGGHGDMKSELDQKLRDVIASYTNNPVLYGKSPRCGIDKPWYPGLDIHGWEGTGSDSCMDDYAVGASAYAWIAAYEYKAGRSYTTYRDLARTAIQQAFDTDQYGAFRAGDSICVYNPDLGMPPITGRGPCNVTTSAQLSTALAGAEPRGIYSLNRSQNAVYGVGLMASISSAFIGLEEAGSQTSLSFDQNLIAMALLKEGQRKSDPDGTYFKGHLGGSPTCARFEIENGVVNQYNDQPCADYDQRPRAYAVNARPWRDGLESFYSRYVSGTPATTVVDLGTTQAAHQFNVFDSNLFYLNPDDHAIMNWGRRVTYGNLGFFWHTLATNSRDLEQPPPTGSDYRGRLLAKLDDHNPIGYLDGIDANGVAYGWTCDRDLPNESNYVDFLVNGQAIVRARANFYSEPGITTECTAGSYHRFAAQLPSWTKGSPIYAYGLDRTWRGITLLPGWQCASNPACTW
jgi:hypothetical protein